MELKLTLKNIDFTFPYLIIGVIPFSYTMFGSVHMFEVWYESTFGKFELYGVSKYLYCETVSWLLPSSCIAFEPVCGPAYLLPPFSEKLDTSLLLFTARKVSMSGVLGVLESRNRLTLLSKSGLDSKCRPTVNSLRVSLK